MRVACARIFQCEKEMLYTNCEFLRPEIMDVLRAFGCENEEFTHYFSCSCGKILNSVEYGGRFYDFEEECKEEDGLVLRRLAKRYAKLAFYLVLSSVKGELPWGALTGIRPTKLAYAERSAGRDFKDLFSALHVSADNTALVERVLQAQKGIYRRGGQDLYISLPFCPSKCEYCSFITAPIARTRGYVEEYISCLEKELQSLRPVLKDVRSVYVGGGTPFVLESSQLTRIYQAVNELLPARCEYTVEAGRPDVFTEEKLKLARDFGVNRICVNPQTFHDATLEKIGRKHTAAQTVAAYERARAFGFDINIDLIAGLADERAQDFAESVERAVSLDPENVTVHTLCLKAGARLKEEVDRLHVTDIADMIALSRDKLTAAGYEPYYLYRQKYQAGGLENVGWAKPGKACVYNIDVMEETCDNVAVGANAISKRLYGDEDRIERLASPKDIPTYLAKVDKMIADRLKLFG